MVTGDAMESWETTPDGLQFTFKLRRNHKFDPRPPTNNRAMTTADVKYSVERFESGSAFRGEVLQKFSPTGMIDSISFPDDYTVTMKLAFPYGNFQEALAFYPYFVIMPMETERFNPRSEMRGSGPFRLMEFRPDQKLVYARNPDWYVKDRPFLDGFEQLIIPEYATALAQFETGTLWTMNPSSQNVAQEDILPVKQRHTELLLTTNLANIKSPQFQYFHFSMKADNAFRDVRLRQAVSMLIDRGAIVDTFYNLPAFRSAGLPAEGMWHSHDYAGQPNWIDPQRKASELGEGAKNFQFNVAESRKLISAAGKDGYAFPFEYQTGCREAIRDHGPHDSRWRLKPDIKVIDAATHRYQARRASATTACGRNEWRPATRILVLNLFHRRQVHCFQRAATRDLGHDLAIRKRPTTTSATRCHEIQRKLTSDAVLLPGMRSASPSQPG
jgi:ABC-type transport system substrate-binding protein